MHITVKQEEIMIQKHPKDWHEVLTKETEG